MPGRNPPGQINRVVQRAKDAPADGGRLFQFAAIEIAFDQLLGPSLPRGNRSPAVLRETRESSPTREKSPKASDGRLPFEHGRLAGGFRQRNRPPLAVAAFERHSDRAGRCRNETLVKKADAQAWAIRPENRRVDRRSAPPIDPGPTVASGLSSEPPGSKTGRNSGRPPGIATARIRRSRGTGPCPPRLIPWPQWARRSTASRRDARRQTPARRASRARCRRSNAARGAGSRLRESAVSVSAMRKMPVPRNPSIVNSGRNPCSATVCSGNSLHIGEVERAPATPAACRDRQAG